MSTTDFLPSQLEDVRQAARARLAALRKAREKGELRHPDETNNHNALISHDGSSLLFYPSQLLEEDASDPQPQEMPKEPVASQAPDEAVELQEPQESFEQPEPQPSVTELPREPIHESVVEDSRAFPTLFPEMEKEILEIGNMALAAAAARDKKSDDSR